MFQSRPRKDLSPPIQDDRHPDELFEQYTSHLISTQARSRAHQDFRAEQEEYLLNPTSPSSSQSPSTSRTSSRDYDYEELDAFARPINRSRQNEGGGKRRRVLFSLSLISLVTISYFSFKHYNQSIPSIQLQPTHPPKKPDAKLSNSDKDVLQRLNITLPPGIHLKPQRQPSHPPLPELPLEYHRDPLPINRFKYPENAKRRKVQEVDLFRPIWERENCVDDWISKGEICQDLNHHGLFGTKVNVEEWKNRKIDVVWTWVNGSDSRHQVSRRMHHTKPSGRWADDSLDYDFFKEKEIWERLELEKEKEHEKEKGKGIMKLNPKEKIIKRANNPMRYPPPRPKIFKPDDTDERFRETDELRYSMRSAVKHLGRNNLGTLHVISPDYAAPRELQDPAKSRDLEALISEEMNRRRIDRSAGGRLEVRAPLAESENVECKFPSELSLNETSDHFTSRENGKLRLGQVPSWLDTSKKDSVFAGDRSMLPNSFGNHQDVKVRVHHDWNIFNHNFLLPPNRDLTVEESEEILKWKREVLPTFNSMSVEAMIGDLPSLSETFISSNDDFFFGKDLSISEFNSPLYGLIFHLQPDLLVGQRVPGSIEASFGHGEWPGLHDSNYLLNQRFGKKDRAYVSHVHRSFSKPLLLEMKMIWAKEIFRSSSARWRSQNARDLVNHFLFTHFVIERHREALLWSLLVGKIDKNGDGKLDQMEYDAFLTSIGMTTKAMKSWKDSLSNPHDNPIPILKIPIRLPERSSLRDEKVFGNLAKIGEPKLRETRLQFSSHDGYPFIKLNPMVQLNPPTPGAGKGAIVIKTGLQFEPYPQFIPNDSTRYRFGEDLDMQDPLERPHPAGIKNANQPSTGNKSKASKGAEDLKKAACSIDLDDCFIRKFKRDGNVDTTEVFKRFAFEKRECGDCLILQGIRKSGKQGFDFFLPDKDQVFPSSQGTVASHQAESPPHLPLTKSSGSFVVSEKHDDDLEEIELPDFSLDSISKELGWEGRGIREFSRRLILRYTYSIGE